MNLNNLRKIDYINAVLWLVWPVGFLVLVIFMFLTCNNKGTVNKDDSAEAVATGMPDSLAGQVKTFRLPGIPAMLTSPEERAEYLAGHYWDNFDFSDTTYIHLPEVTEQAFANYLDLLPRTKEATAITSIKQMLRRSTKEDTTGRTYAYFLEKYKSYLADPNSPFRSEAYYIPVTEYIINDKISNEATKSRAEFDLKMMLKNKTGSKAVDFNYYTSNNNQGRLYGIDSQYTLLYFYNPDCPACKETTAYLKESVLVHHLIKKGILTVLAVYPDDDLAAWQAHQANLPDLWHNAHDRSQTIIKKQLYDLKAMPTLYLLDRDKRVILKDAPPVQVEAWLDGAMSPDK